MPSLVVGPLAVLDVRTTYPLALSGDPSISLADWLRYTRRVAGYRSRINEGVLVARRSGMRHPCGLACYHRIHAFGRGPVLMAERLVALDLLRPEAILSALIDALDRTAARLGCTSVRLIVNSPCPPGLERLGRPWASSRGVVFTRVLPAAPGQKR